MKLHYFDQEQADQDDTMLRLCIQQGYVPATCLLGGMTAIYEVQGGRDPCAGCHCDRAKCHGRPENGEGAPMRRIKELFGLAAVLLVLLGVVVVGFPAMFFGGCCALKLAIWIAKATNFDAGLFAHDILALACALVCFCGLCKLICWLEKD